MIKLIIFDLDGVIVSTDKYHYEAWKALSEANNFIFNKQINNLLRGVSRQDSLEIILKHNNITVKKNKFDGMLNTKNNLYRKKLLNLTPKDILPGVMKLLKELKSKKKLIAVGSSSKNTPLILEKIGLLDYFDAIIDGNQISNSKPNPEVFLKSAQALDVDPKDCVVIEDAQAGIDAALNGGMLTIGVGDIHLQGADLMVSNLKDICCQTILSIHRIGAINE